MRRVLLALAVALVAAAGASTPTPAQASTYRYWAYWHGTASAWKYSSTGPYFTRIKTDKWVDGWRFGSSDPYGPLPPPPNAPYSYDKLGCTTPVRSGYARVAIVIDFGSPSDVPPGDNLPSKSVSVVCTSVPLGTDALTALQAPQYGDVPVREDSSSFICGIDGYPRTECAGVDPTAPAPAVTPTIRTTATATAHAVPTSASATTSAPASSPAANPTLSASPTTSPSPAAPPVAAASSFVAAPLPNLASSRRTSPWQAIFGALVVVVVGGLAWRSSRARRH